MAPEKPFADPIVMVFEAAAPAAEEVTVAVVGVRV